MEKITFSAKETENFAKGFAKKLKPGNVVALYGDLGAGKTTFIKGLAQGLGYKKGVYSPTFIFIRTYHLNDQRSKIKNLHHIDLYRAEDISQLSSVGLEEFLVDKEAVVVIEWPEKIEEELPSGTIKVKIDYLEDNKRNIKVV